MCLWETTCILVYLCRGGFGGSSGLICNFFLIPFFFQLKNVVPETKPFIKMSNTLVCGLFFLIRQRFHGSSLMSDAKTKHFLASYKANSPFTNSIFGKSAVRHGVCKKLLFWTVIEVTLEKRNVALRPWPLWLFLFSSLNRHKCGYSIDMKLCRDSKYFQDLLCLLELLV